MLTLILSFASNLMVYSNFFAGYWEVGDFVTDINHLSELWYLENATLLPSVVWQISTFVLNLEFEVTTISYLKRSTSCEQADKLQQASFLSF